MSELAIQDYQGITSSMRDSISYQLRNFLGYTVGSLNWSDNFYQEIQHKLLATIFPLATNCGEYH